MAKALECPACGARHRLDSLPGTPTFRCERCGQVLKAPVSVSSDPSAPPPPSRTAARTGAPPPVAPPPRRTAPATDVVGAAAVTRNAPAASASATGAAAAVSATVSASPSAENGSDPARGGRRTPPAATSAARSRVHWYWRLLAWVVAVPLGFVLTAWPAYAFGFIKKDDLLDIFVGTGIGRYVRLGIVTLAWALVTALLVQLFVEGGRVRAARRRRARAAPA
jgi:hypothetical protein